MECYLYETLFLCSKADELTACDIKLNIRQYIASRQYMAAETDLLLSDFGTPAHFGPKGLRQETHFIFIYCDGVDSLWSLFFI